MSYQSVGTGHTRFSLQMRSSLYTSTIHKRTSTSTVCNCLKEISSITTYCQNAQATHGAVGNHSCNAMQWIGCQRSRHLCWHHMAADDAMALFQEEPAELLISVMA